MALIADIRVNNHHIGRVIAVRRGGKIGDHCRYAVSGFTMPHPTTGEEIDVTCDELIPHHYDDSPVALMSKAFKAVLEEAERCSGT